MFWMTAKSKLPDLEDLLLEIIVEKYRKKPSATIGDVQRAFEREWKKLIRMVEEK